MGSGIYIIPYRYDFLALSGGTVTGNTVFTQNLTATTYYSGSTPLQTAIYNIVNQFSSSTLTFSAGNNLFVITASTYPNITYGLNDSIYINGNISGGTFFSGGTNIQDLFILSGISLGTGITVFEQKLNNNLLFNTIVGSGQTTVSKSNNRIILHTPPTTIPFGAYIWTGTSGNYSYKIRSWTGESNSNFTLVASQNSNIGYYAHYSGLFVGRNNTINKNSTSSVIVGGEQNTINDSKYGAIIGGTYNVLGKFYSSGGAAYQDDSVIIGGERNRLYRTYHSAIIAGGNNLITGDTYSSNYGVYGSSIIGGISNTIKGAWNSIILGGQRNIITHDANGSVIVGGNDITANTPNTVIVPQLRIVSVTEATALTPYSLFVNSSGYVYRKNINGANGISINNGLSSITISYTGATTIGINNGLNTYTGGTNLNPTVNISGATLSYLSAGTLSGGTILSGGTDIGNIFVVSGATSGNGNSIFINKINNNLLFKSLSAGTNINFVDNGSLITISASNSSSQTLIQDGLNTYTGGTSSAPTVNISGATLTFLSAGTLSGGTIFSGGTDVNLLLGEKNTASNIGGAGTDGIFAQKNGIDLQFKSLSAGTGISFLSSSTVITIINTSTGSTNISGNFLPISGGTVTGQTNFVAGLSANTLSGGTIFSGDTDIGNIFVVSGATSGNGNSVFINKINNNLLFKSLSAGTNIGFVDNGSLITISAVSLSQTLIQDGLNTYTGGTSSNPTVNISGATLTFLSAGTLSGGTIFSGGTNIQNIFVTSGQNISNSGTTVFIDKTNSILRFRTFSGASGTSISVNNNIITFSSPNIPSSAYLFVSGTGYGSIIQNNGGNYATGRFSFAVGTGNTATANYGVSLNGKKNSVKSLYGAVIGGINNIDYSVRNGLIISSSGVSISSKVRNYNSVIGSKNINILANNTRSSYYNLVSNSLNSKLYQVNFGSIIGSKSVQIGYYSSAKPITSYAKIHESLNSKSYSNFSNISNSRNAFIIGVLSSGSTIINSYAAVAQTFIRYNKRSSLILSVESYIDANPVYKDGYNNHIIASDSSYSYNSHNSLLLLTKSSSNGYKTFNKQFFSGLLIGTKAVSNKSNKYGFAINSISGAVVFSATYSGLINSKSSNINNSFTAQTSMNLLIVNSSDSEINSGKHNTIIGSLQGSIRPNDIVYGGYNSIVGGIHNEIIGGNKNFIIGGGYNRVYSGIYSGIIGGKSNTITASYNGSVIIGGKDLVLSKNYTVAVPELRVSTLPISSGYIVVADATGYLKNSSISSSTLIIGISNGLNTYTGGTLSNPRINISGATLTFLSAGTLSGGTILSGNSDLDTIFHKKGGYLLQKNGTISGSTFSGVPLIYTLTFTTSFIDNNYAVSIVGEDARMWSISGKTLSGFTINSNSSVLINGNVFWTASENGEGFR